MTHTSQAILNISMCLQDPNTGLKMKGKRKEIEIDMNILQNLDSLRNRPGDTNSVVWRAS